MKKMIQDFTQFAVLLIVLAGCGSMLLLSDDDNISNKVNFTNSTQIESVSPVDNQIAPTEKIKIKKSLSI